MFEIISRGTEPPTGDSEYFAGQLATCVMCERQEIVGPMSSWRVILDQQHGTTYYACPDEFPPPGQSGKMRAYQRILERIQHVGR